MKIKVIPKRNSKITISFFGKIVYYKISKNTKNLQKRRRIHERNNVEDNKKI